jgi:hypothetical protein
VVGWTRVHALDSVWAAIMNAWMDGWDSFVYVNFRGWE